MECGVFFWLDLLWKRATNNPKASLVHENLGTHKLGNSFVFASGKERKVEQSIRFREEFAADYYRSQLNGIAHYSGYSPWLFGLHSFRSGHQVACYINLVSCGKNASDAWNTIGLYIGYPPKAAHQQAYFRNEFRTILVMGRALDPSTLLEIDGKIIAENKLNPEDFHGIKLQPQWKLEDNLRYPRRFLADYLKEHHPPESSGQAKRMITEIAKLFHNDDTLFEQLEIQRKRIEADRKARSLSEDPRDRLQHRVFLAFLMAKAENDLKQNGTPLWATLETCLEQHDVQNKLSGFAELYIKRGSLSKKRKPHKKKAEPEKRSLKESAKKHCQERKHKQEEQRKAELTDRQEKINAVKEPRAKKRPWTDLETKILCEKYVLEGPRWVLLASLVTTRSNVQCKDRMRTLQSQLQTPTELQAATTWLQRYTEEDNNDNDDEFDDMMNDNDNNDSGEHGSDE